MSFVFSVSRRRRRPRRKRRRRRRKKRRRRWWRSQRLPTRRCKGKKLPRRKKAPTAKRQTKRIGESFDMFYLRLSLTSNSAFIVFLPGFLRYSYDTKQGSKRSVGGGTAVGRRQEGQGQGGIDSGPRKGDTVAAATIRRWLWWSWGWMSWRAKKRETRREGRGGFSHCREDCQG